MNKLTKLLSVFILAGAVGAGVAGVAGCTKKDDGNNGGGHTHNYTWVNDNNGKCHEHCGVAGCDTPDKPAQDHVDTKNNETQANGADGKCDHCGATLTPSGALAAPAGAMGIIVEYEGEDVELSMENKTASIDLAKVKVYFEVNSAKGTAVPAANYDVEISKDGDPISTLIGLKQGSYEISATLKNVTSGGSAVTWDSFTQFTITNPVVTNSLVVKTGATLTQVAGVDTISSGWTYEVTLANGDKQDVPAAGVTVSGLETMTEGENKTATLSCTVGGVAVSGSVQYTITKNENVVNQKYALNFSFLTGEQETQIKNGTLVQIDEHFSVISANKGEIAKEDKTVGTKYFAKRLKWNGASTKDDARYIKITTQGVGTLTVYANNQGSSDDRYLSVYSQVSEAGIPVTESLVKDSAGNPQKSDVLKKADGIQVVNFVLPQAGTYYLCAEVNGLNIDYVELSQNVNKAEGVEAVELGGTVSPVEVNATHSSGKSAHVTVGATFDSIKSQYTVKTLGVNNVTCESTQTDVTADEKVTFEVPEDFTTVIGEKTITVKYDNSLTSTFKVYVESAVSGIYGMTSALKGDISTQVTAGTQFTLKKSDIVNTLLGASDNANAQITAYTVTYNETEIDDEAGTQFAISATAYTVTISATVSDGTNNATLTATVEFTVSELSTAPKQSFVTPDAVPTEATVAAGATITENNLFKAVAVGGMDYATGGKLSESAVKATLQDNTEKTFSTGLRTAKSSGAGDANKTSAVTITAKEKITLKIVAITCNDGYSANKAGKLYYAVGEGNAVSTACGSDRNAPAVLTVELEANQTLTLNASGDGEAVRMWLFAIEATQAETSAA